MAWTKNTDGKFQVGTLRVKFPSWFTTPESVVQHMGKDNVMAMLRVQYPVAARRNGLEKMVIQGATEADLEAAVENTDRSFEFKKLTAVERKAIKLAQLEAALALVPDDAKPAIKQAIAALRAS